MCVDDNHVCRACGGGGALRPEQGRTEQYKVLLSVCGRPELSGLKSPSTPEFQIFSVAMNCINALLLSSPLHLCQFVLFMILI